MNEIYKAAHDVLSLELSNLSNQVNNVSQEFQITAFEHRRPCVLFKPSIYIDGEKWCALYGTNIQDGIAGFGDTPEKAMIDFDLNFLNQKPPLIVRPTDLGD